jgi:hypothetical protein
MQKLRIEDTWNILEYEKKRGEFRRRIIQIKKKRRIAVGEHITLVFENRDTMLFQVQEMIRIERIVDEAQIAQEIEVYNSLIPAESELSATLFVEAQERSELRSLLRQLVGLDQYITLRIGDHFAVPARFEEGRSLNGQISSIQYIRFPFTAEQRAAFCNGSKPVSIVISHPNYQANATLSTETLAALVQDFGQH